MKEKVKFYKEKQGLSIRGSEWTLWVRQVKNKEGDILYVLKPLKAHYDPEKHTFHYETMANPIWLDAKDFGTLISTLVQMRDEVKGGK